VRPVAPLARASSRGLAPCGWLGDACALRLALRNPRHRGLGFLGERPFALVRPPSRRAVPSSAQHRAQALWLQQGRLARHPAGLRPAAGWGTPAPCGWLDETLAIVASGFLANVRSLSYARPPGGQWHPPPSTGRKPCGCSRPGSCVIPRACALRLAGGRLRPAAGFTKPSPSWPRVSWRTSVRSRTPALQAGSAILHPAQGASPVAAAGPARTSSRGLAPCGWLGDTCALRLAGRHLRPAACWGTPAPCGWLSRFASFIRCRGAFRKTLPHCGRRCRGRAL
jgi:hypothetical protein